MRLRISLANKCQLLFGAAVLLILGAALWVPWFRMAALVADAQREIAGELSDAWLSVQLNLYGDLYSTEEPLVGGDSRHPRQLRVVTRDHFQEEAERSAFFVDALAAFESPRPERDILITETADDGQRLYRYARAVRESDIERLRTSFDAGVGTPPIADELQAVMLIDMRPGWVDQQLLLNRVYIITAGLLAVLLAIAVFWLITTRLILSPVRVLRDTAERVSGGDLNIRADINTGDEFEQLSDTFNQMLTNLKFSQDKLRDLNKQLDLKLGELAKSNLTLYEANRVKGDFLANVSHELRTPLNSVIGFAEVLEESLASPSGNGDDAAMDKRRRYVRNIKASSQALLQMITELLDLARIEAGRIELHVEPMSVRDVCEVMLTLIRPQADAKRLALRLNLQRELPVVHTDTGRFQQIVSNFLSNAVKFTPPSGRIELGAAAVYEGDSSGAGEGVEPTGVRIWVTDNGPGIPLDQHDAIFDKFQQLDSSHTKEHAGTGLGLAISRELARLLQGRIELISDVGQGATFALTVPLTMQPESAEPLMPDLAGR